ncbi:MAG: STM4504/CBY_0614 family protein [Bryobacteraceae bacterium]
MSVFDLFSKRQRALRGETPDVYTYDEIPQAFRVQVVQIWHDALGADVEYHDMHRQVRQTYQFIVETLRREYGVFQLSDMVSSYEGGFISELRAFLLNEPDHERVLDAIELSFRAIDRCTREFGYLIRKDASQRADAAIEELNCRFREHGIGYQFEGEIIRVDSQLLHSEVVKPTLALLSRPAYKGAQEEFLRGYEHYRHGRMKEALNESLKALESTMKVICSEHGWGYDPRATAKDLLNLILGKGLVPPFWTQHFSGLRATLEGGVPTVRNKLGGHGQGTEVVEVPAYLVAYALHQTAAAILFLAEAEKAFA